MLQRGSLPGRMVEALRILIKSRRITSENCSNLLLAAPALLTLLPALGRCHLIIFSPSRWTSKKKSFFFHFTVNYLITNGAEHCTYFYWPFVFLLRILYRCHLFNYLLGYPTFSYWSLRVFLYLRTLTLYLSYVNISPSGFCLPFNLKYYF